MYFCNGFVNAVDSTLVDSTFSCLGKIDSRNSTFFIFTQSFILQSAVGFVFNLTSSLFVELVNILQWKYSACNFTFTIYRYKIYIIVCSSELWTWVYTSFLFIFLEKCFSWKCRFDIHWKGKHGYGYTS